jgi:hypothetical protein
MNLDRYPISSSNNRTAYEFLSKGPKGTIRKLVLFEKISTNLFNLSFGDWDEENQIIEDKTRSNNNDRDKVLATVASAVIDFMAHHPNAILFAEGITPIKTRLYQMGINQNLQEISQLFDIEGYHEENWEPFRSGKNYEAFNLKARKRS